MARHKIDMTGVEEFTSCEEGKHLAKIVSMEEKTASTGTEMEVGCFEVIRGNSTGARVYENFPLTKKALFKVKKLLGALGLPNEGKNVTFDTDKIIGKTLTIEVSQYEYDGKSRCRIDDFYPAAAAGKKGKPADDDIDEDDFDEEEAANEYEDMSAKELYALCKEREIKVKPKQDASLYIEKLVAWDAKNADKDEDDEDDWADDED